MPSRKRRNVFVTDVVDAIRRLPLLKHLQLDGILKSLPVSITSLPLITSTASLPHLQELHLGASASTCAYFLDLCQLPASTRIYLIFFPCPPSAIPLLVSPLSTKLSASLVDNEKDVLDMFTLSKRGLGFLKRVPGDQKHDHQRSPHLTITL